MLARTATAVVTRAVDLNVGDEVIWGDETRTVTDIHITENPRRRQRRRLRRLRERLQRKDRRCNPASRTRRKPQHRPLLRQDPHRLPVTNPRRRNFSGHAVTQATPEHTPTVSDLAVGDVVRLVSGKHATVTADEGTTGGLRRLLLDLRRLHHVGTVAGHRPR